MSKKIFSLAAKLLLVYAFLFFCGPVHAQYENGSLVGVIRDASGAPVPKANVKITNTATGISTAVTTNGTGEYDVPSLRVGTYSIDASASGFSDAVAENITVSVGVRQHIDLALKVGGTATTVEVSGVALQLDSETSQRGQTITNAQSEALPLVSRNYSDLLGLVTGSRQAPTAATTSSISSLVRAGSYNVNGLRSMFNNFLLDGMDNNAYGESNQGFDNQIIAVPPDSVAQFQVVTNNESAEYGRSAGATINVATLSGTNAIHATGYEFLRNTDLNAAGFFKPTTVSNLGTQIPFQKPTFNRNQFGINVGGPILKNKLFYFLDYEGFRQTLTPLNVLTLPTQNELNGILAVPVKNATTGVAYAAGTAIPASAINPLSANIITYFKQIAGLPTIGSITGASPTGLASNDYAVQVPFTDSSDKGDLRFDFQQSAKSSWFLRVSDRKEDGKNYPTIPLPLDGQANGQIRLIDQQVALGYTHLFDATKIVDARLGLSRTKAGKYTFSLGDNAFAIPGLQTVPGNLAGGLPAVGITGFTGFGRQTTNPQWQNPSLIDPKVNFTWVKGRHTLKFGYEYEHVWMAVNDNNPLYGSWTYGGGYSTCTLSYSPTCATNINGAANTGATVSDDYWADFLFGTTSSYSLANYFVAHLRQTTNNAYAQDDWKVNDKLTLNLGLRWEYSSPYSEQNDYISNFDPASQTVFTIDKQAVSGNGITQLQNAEGIYGKTLVHPDYKDFAPRVGFSSAVDPKTVIRGGFGMSYVHYTRAGSGDILAINAPQAQFASVTQITPSTTNHCSSPLPAQIIATGATAPSCYATADQGYPTGLVTSFNSATDNITWVPANTRDSYVESYYLSVQRQLFKNSLLDVAYVGNHGVKLQGFINGNQKNPANGFARPFANWPSDITEAINQFWSNYNALQVRYEQRMVAGLTVLNSFTWEHSLDNASASLEGNTPSPQDGNNLRADYGQSDYNLPVANITSLIYDLPFGRGRHFGGDWKAPLQAIAGGWQVSVINTAQAGTPFNITFTPNSAQQVSQQISATYRGANEYRPYRVPGVPVTQGKGNRAANTGYVNYVNLNAFVLQPIRDGAATGGNPPGNILSPFGNASRNPGRTPAFYQTDFDLNKRFDTPLKGLKLEFRAEFYNVFNHTNLYLPSTIGGAQATLPANNSAYVYGVGGSAPLSAIQSVSATNGVPTSGGQISSTFEPRIIQFGFKVLY